MDFLTAAQDMQKGKSKTPKRERGNSKKGAAGSRGNTPLKASVLAGAAEDEGRARVIAWAKEQAASHLVEAEKERVEETKKAKADDENRNSSADKQARQQVRQPPLDIPRAPIPHPREIVRGRKISLQSPSVCTLLQSSLPPILPQPQPQRTRATICECTLGLTRDYCGGICACAF
jgi:hypothetical protein